MMMGVLENVHIVDYPEKELMRQVNNGKNRASFE